jgi:hypothetical protein
MIYRGTIVGLFRESGGSGIALLGVEDDVKGRMLIPCDGNPTCRAFNVVFPGTLRDGTFHNSAIEGERIYFTLDDVGVLAAFAPEDRAPEEIIAQYEKQSAPSKMGTSTFHGFLPPGHPLFGAGPVVAGRPLSGKGSHTRGGFAPPDHPLYSAGPIVSGRPLSPPPKGAGFVDRGYAKPDDPIYSSGPIVAGRAILQPYRKMTPEEIEELFQRGRDAIAKGKPTDN